MKKATVKLIDAEYQGEKVKAIKLTAKDPLMKKWNNEILPSRDVIEKLARKGLKEDDTIKQAKIAVEIMEVQKTIDAKRKEFWQEVEKRLTKDVYDADKQYLTIDAEKNLVYIREDRDDRQDQIMAKMDRLLDKMLAKHDGHSHDDEEGYSGYDIDGEEKRVAPHVIKRTDTKIRKLALDADKMANMTYKQMIDHIGKLSNYEVPLKIAKDVANEVWQTIHGKKYEEFGYSEDKGFTKSDD